MSHPETDPMLAARCRPGALALVAGGVLFAAGNLMHPLQHNEAAYERPLWELAHVILLVSIPLLLLGLPSLERSLRRRGARNLPPAVAVLSVVGFVGMAPGLLVEAFIAPEVGHSTMTRIENGGFGTVSGAFAVCWIASLPVLFFALRNARVAAAPVRWSFLVGGVGLVTLGNGDSELAGAVIIAATAAYGFAIALVGLALARRAAMPAGPTATMRLPEPAR
jgi:hypothetical protein